MSFYGDGSNTAGLPPGSMGVSAPVGREFSMSSDLDPGIVMSDSGLNSGYLSMSYHYDFDENSFQLSPMAMQAGQSLDEHNEVSNGNADTFSGPGAGPLPAGFGVAPIPNGGSTLTEFTKRRNWPQRVLEEVKDFLHILSPDGRIIYCSPSTEQLTGYKSQELIGKFIYNYIHQDDSATFAREFNESIASGNMLRFFYRFRKADQSFIIFESHGHPHLTTEIVAFGANNTAGFCRGFFMMSRPYPTKNAGLLDSFLEHKIENERLTRRIADLKREEREEDEAQQVAMRNTQGSPSDSAGSPLSGVAPTQDQLAMPPPSKPGIANTALTQKNLDAATAAQQQDSINDKMARYEGATHIETIEMLTGLRYRDGERSQGISTGDASPALIRGDAGIAISADKDARGDKKKKFKVADEYVCTDCGTLDSPEWRKGPGGPKTLCNACGLRWAKKEKKRASLSGNDGTTPQTPSLVQSNSQGSA